jgi:hypothetical protein
MDRNHSGYRSVDRVTRRVIARPGGLHFADYISGKNPTRIQIHIRDRIPLSGYVSAMLVLLNNTRTRDTYTIYKKQHIVYFETTTSKTKRYERYD